MEGDWGCRSGEGEADREGGEVGFDEEEEEEGGEGEEDWEQGYAGRGEAEEEEGYGED